MFLPKLVVLRKHLVQVNFQEQVTNMRRNEELKGRSGDAAADDPFVVMQRAHTEDPSAQFIRGIRTAPDPAIVLAYDFQINDMVLFCTSSTAKFCVLTIDPTLSLGEFDVTPITYRHLLLESKRSNAPPIFLGPVLVITAKCLLHTYSLLQLLSGCVVRYRV